MLEETMRQTLIEPDTNIIIAGDLNARKAQRIDYHTLDRNVHEFHGYEDILDDRHMHTRNSCDKQVNSFGLALIEFCKTYDLRIANGRLQFHEDRLIG